MDIGVLIPIIAVGGFFSSIIIFTYMHYSSRHRERMALIESGQDAGIFHREKKMEHGTVFLVEKHTSTPYLPYQPINMARGGEWGPTDVFVTLFSMFSITLPLIVFKKK